MARKWYIYISYTMLLAEIATAILIYLQLPSQIPIHYNLNDQPDGYGYRSMLFVLPAVNAFLFMVISGFIWLYKKYYGSRQGFIDLLYFIRIFIPLYGLLDITEPYMLLHGNNMHMVKYISYVPIFTIVFYFVKNRKQIMIK